MLLVLVDGVSIGKLILMTSGVEVNTMAHNRYKPFFSEVLTVYNRENFGYKFMGEMR